MTQITFQNEHLTLCPEGTLLWPRLNLLAVADLHLEKGSACAGRGRLVPPWDSALTLARLAALVRLHRPAVIVAVGDSFHDRAAAARLGETDRALLGEIVGGARMIWVLGNHDPVAPAGVGGEAVAELAVAGLVFRHQAVPRAVGEISGHFHPKARIRTRAGDVTRPCFFCDDSKIMLPAFGAYTGGLDIRAAAIGALYPAGGRAYLLGRDALFGFDIAAGAQSGGEPGACGWRGAV